MRVAAARAAQPAPPATSYAAESLVEAQSPMPPSRATDGDSRRASLHREVAGSPTKALDFAIAHSCAPLPERRHDDTRRQCAARAQTAGATRSAAYSMMGMRRMLAEALRRPAISFTGAIIFIRRGAQRRPFHGEYFFHHCRSPPPAAAKRRRDDSREWAYLF